jgi:O-antigen biosynthesis protein WbqP
LDGDYVEKLNAGKFKGLAMDWKCFWGTIFSVLKSDGVVEGGTGEMKKQQVANEQMAETIEEVALACVEVTEE